MAQQQETVQSPHGGVTFRPFNVPVQKSALENFWTVPITQRLGNMNR